MTVDAKTIFALVGLIYFVTRAGIVTPIRVAIASRGRFIAGLLYCPACSGFWIGIAYALIYKQPWLGCVHLGLVSMGLGAICNYFFHNIDDEFQGVVKTWQEGEAQ